MYKKATRLKKSASFTILVIIFLILIIICLNFSRIFNLDNIKAGFSNNNLGNIQQIQDFQNIQINSSNLNDEDYNWYLEIPCINLKAQIADGVTKEIMDKFIGHFEETPKIIGNVALAAHNRGYENNYFHDLKKLKEGDEIRYSYKEDIKKYIVKNHFIIKDTDLSCLENTEDNTITLITCVENEPEYRRCIQAVEKIGKEE